MRILPLVSTVDFKSQVSTLLVESPGDEGEDSKRAVFTDKAFRVIRAEPLASEWIADVSTPALDEQ